MILVKRISSKSSSRKYANALKMTYFDIYILSIPCLLLSDGQFNSQYFNILARVLTLTQCYGQKPQKFVFSWRPMADFYIFVRGFNLIKAIFSLDFLKTWIEYQNKFINQERAQEISSCKTNMKSINSERNWKSYQLIKLKNFFS